MLIEKSPLNERDTTIPQDESEIISARLVKTLRDKTGLGFMDCKKALIQNNGNLNEAVDWLRVQGYQVAVKHAHRVASEGVIAITTAQQRGVIIELNSETDFVAQNVTFQSLAQKIVNTIFNQQTEEQNVDASHLILPEEGHTIAEDITRLMSSIRENIVLRRWKILTVAQGVIGSYIHNKLKSEVAPHIGRVGVLVALESDAQPDKLKEIAKQLAIHIAASSPQAITIDTLEPTIIDRERTVFTQQAQRLEKPSHIIDKIVEGSLRKFYKQVVLLEQTYVIDGKSVIKDVIAQKEQELGTPIIVRDFIHFKLGELSKEQDL